VDFRYDVVFFRDGSAATVLASRRVRYEEAEGRSRRVEGRLRFDREGAQGRGPFGEDCDFDLVLCREGLLERVQVKYATSLNGVIQVKCKSHSLTNGKVRRTKHYTSATIDWLAIYDATTDCCFYVPAGELGTGRSMLHRLAPTRNGQAAGVRLADDYRDLPCTDAGSG
jgi:PD-(D/E)XK endonuclease